MTKPSDTPTELVEVFYTENVVTYLCPCCLQDVSRKTTVCPYCGKQTKEPK